MVSPYLLSKKSEEETIEVSVNAKRVFQAVYNQIKKEAKKEEYDDEPTINVSELISKMAFFYEKLRNAVDYEEEHLLRKNAIYRILKRQIFIEGVLRSPDSLELSEHLLRELIRGAYLPNNKLKESKILEVSKILKKYILLKNFSLNNVSTDKGKERNKFAFWLISLAACEIEDYIGENEVKQAIVTSLFDLLSKKIKLALNTKFSESELRLQIYLSICRTFLKYDKDMMTLVAFKYYNQGWIKKEKGKIIFPQKETVETVAKNLLKIKKAIDFQLNHPVARQLDKVVHKYALYFSILEEVLDNEPAQKYRTLKNHAKTFFAQVAKVCEKKYKKAKSKLWGAAIRSIIYIFLTKSIFAILIEVPAIYWLGEELKMFTLVINIAFPALLLFLIVLFTRIPGKSNTLKIIEGVKEIVSEEEKINIITIRAPRKRSLILNVFFHLLYGAFFLVSLYFIYTALTYLGFNWVSILIFLFFLAFVSFFSVRITKGVKELLIIEKKESFISFLTDLFYMPIIVAGKWLSNNASRVNVFIFIFDFIIEAPFKVLVNIAEDWTQYIKERRDKLN
jgi:hypothetical protein